MALEEFSTLLSIQQRANEKRILGWTDKNKDDIPDPGTLTQGFQEVTGIMFEYLNKRYGETALATWTISLAPARLLSISDDLCLWYFGTSNNAQAVLLRTIYEDAIASLEKIRDGINDLYGATEDMSDRFVVEDLEDGYEELIYYNE